MQIDEDETGIPLSTKFVLSAIMTTVIGFLTFLFAAPLLLLLTGPIMGPILALGLVSMAIGCIGHYLRLIDFPLVQFLGSEMSTSEGQDVLDRVQRTGAALPLAFAASMTWAVLAAITTGLSQAALLAAVVGPATIAVTMICQDEAGARVAFARSIQWATLMVIVFALFYAPMAAPDITSVAPE